MLTTNDVTRMSTDVQRVDHYDRLLRALYKASDSQEAMKFIDQKIRSVFDTGLVNATLDYVSSHNLNTGDILLAALIENILSRRAEVVGNWPEISFPNPPEPEKSAK